MSRRPYYKFSANPYHRTFPDAACSLRTDLVDPPAAILPRKTNADMRENKLLVIGLDGYDATIADQLISKGRLPNLARLKSSSTRFFLDHGKQKYSGLSWEHFSTGMAPELSHRWSAVAFEPRTYRVVQRATTRDPFFAHISSKAVFFDAPYFDMGKAPQVRGLVNWGAHDPGVAAMSRPRDLFHEISAKFGPYAAADYIYAFTWPSASRTQTARAACCSLGSENRDLPLVVL